MKSPTTKSPAGGASRDGTSLFSDVNYNVVATIVNNRNQSTPLPLLRVFGSPKSVVKKQFAPVIKQYEEEVAQANRRLGETVAEIGRKSKQLDDAEEQLTEEYAEMRPDKAEGPSEDSRNPLRELAKVRAAKTRADQWYKTTYAERIDPIKADLTALYREKIERELRIQFLKAGFKDRLFSALESIPSAERKAWVTSNDGEATISIPTNKEPWAVWAETEHSEAVAWVTSARINALQEMAEITNKKYKIHTRVVVDSTTYPQLKTFQVRWLLHLPDDADSNQMLAIDLASAFDLQDVGIEAGGSDDQYLKKGSSRR